jgi:hypothetical protein
MAGRKGGTDQPEAIIDEHCQSIAINTNQWRSIRTIEPSTASADGSSRPCHRNLLISRNGSRFAVGNAEALVGRLTFSQPSTDCVPRSRAAGTEIVSRPLNYSNKPNSNSAGEEAGEAGKIVGHKSLPGAGSGHIGGRGSAPDQDLYGSILWPGPAHKRRLPAPCSGRHLPAPTAAPRNPGGNIAKGGRIELQRDGARCTHAPRMAWPGASR